MIPSFLAAQARDPFSPALMLIQADALEERGDLAGAKQLRGLAAAGVASIAMIALDASCNDMQTYPDFGMQAAHFLDEHMRPYIHLIRHDGWGCGIEDALGDESGCGDGFADFGAGGKSRSSPGRDGIGDGHWHREEDFPENGKMHQ